MIEIDEIKLNVLKWAFEYLPNFQFRLYLLEYISDTLYSLLNGTKINIIEAPTGAGKSIITIIMAGTLDKYYHYRSYILCSDLHLWQQYYDVFKRFNLYFGCLKGAENYLCDKSNDTYPSAPCRLCKISYNNLNDDNWCQNNEKWNCALNCQYIQDRKKAINSNVTLLTYQLYLPYMNMTHDNTTFTERDVIFCDECHNVPNICLNYGAFSLNKILDLKKYKKLLDYCQDKIECISETEVTDELNRIAIIYDTIMETPYTLQVKLYDLLNEYVDILNSGKIAVCRCEYELYIQEKQSMNKTEYKINEILSWIDLVIGTINRYKTYSENKKEYIVKCDNKEEDMYGEMKWPDEPTITFKFAREDIWVNEFILSHLNIGTIFLSATVGGHHPFDDSIGTKLTALKKSNMFVIPSTFDFSRSPIYYLPGHKMSAEFLEESIIANVNTIRKILSSSLHKHQKGIIHTGSYKIAHRLVDMLDKDTRKRIHIYMDSKDKEEIMQHFELSEDGVLVGPGITEGVDFPGDGCRFNIFLKIPYPFMGDPLVRAKAALFPKWYNSLTTNNVILGIGRGNRTPDDWSITYILDGSFTNLYEATRRQYSKEIQNRLKILKTN